MGGVVLFLLVLALIPPALFGVVFVLSLLVAIFGEK